MCSRLHEHGPTAGYMNMAQHVIVNGSLMSLYPCPCAMYAAKGTLPFTNLIHLCLVPYRDIESTGPDTSLPTLSPCPSHAMCATDDRVPPWPTLSWTDLIHLCLVPCRVIEALNEQAPARQRLAGLVVLDLTDSLGGWHRCKTYASANKQQMH